MTADELIRRLDLGPHPEGGWYRSTWRHRSAAGERPCGSAIYYLLRDVDVSRRHRVDAAEIWHYYCGAPIELSTGTVGGPGDGPDEVRLLGPDLEAGQAPQLLVPASTWQQARTLGPYSLVGCTVSPAFEFGGFEMA